MKLRIALLMLLCGTGGRAVAMPQPPPIAPVVKVAMFTDDERNAIVTYWNTPGRLRNEPPVDVAKSGLYQVRLTPDGSRWFLKYQIAIGAAKAPPTQDPTSAASGTTLTKSWRKWVDARLAADRWLAQADADRANAALGLTITPNSKPQSPAPGLIPADLLIACGSPPPFANSVAPLQATVTFDDNDAYIYLDNVKLWSPSYAYYRFPQGTNNEGVMLKDIPDAELEALFTAAGFSDAERHIVKAVSKLEGGFDAINTYDTGFVSIGFIQFITAEDGRGSLLEVLQREKAETPDDYARDFHRYGIDVTADGTYDIIDPMTGAELTGTDAVMKTIADRRLTAVWQKAGLHSTPFRVAQIKVAKSHYWPADDPITLTVEGQVLTGKVSDVVTSEAGLTTLFDRKVNRGSVAPFPDVLAKVMAQHRLKTLAEARKYEREIIAGCRYRTDFLADKSLTQPR